MQSNPPDTLPNTRTTGAVLRALIASVAFAAVAPLVYAQSSPQSSRDTQAVTRAQGQHELAELEAAGYDPHREDPGYPLNLQAAQARLAAQHQAAALASQADKVPSPAS